MGTGAPALTAAGLAVIVPDPPEGGDSLLTVQIQVCLNCLRHEPGECHAPGCFFWMHPVKDIPANLAMFIVPAPGGSPA